MFEDEGCLFIILIGIVAAFAILIFLIINTGINNSNIQEEAWKSLLTSHKCVLIEANKMNYNIRQNQYNCDGTLYWVDTTVDESVRKELK